MLNQEVLNQEEIISLTSQYLMPTYNRLPIVFERGSGCRLWDKQGKEYLDFVSGLGVNSLGYAYPTVIRAISDQAKTLIHVSNLFHIEQQGRLAELIVKQAFPGKMFFANSGAEANEAAIKLARKYARNKLANSCLHPEIITAYQSFHGRTIATITATGQEKVQKGFEPLVPGFKYVPFNDLAAVNEAMTESTIAVMIEPIQGEGGVNIGTEDYLKGLRELCTRHGILFILDEVQTGLGRTGRFFCYQHAGIEPDIVTMAKALGGGLPIGAVLARDEVASAFSPGSHASTFGGNPLSCAAALAAVQALIDDGIIENARKVGVYFGQRLKGLQEKYSLVKNIKGIGLMWGMELDTTGAQIVQDCLNQGLIINCTMNTVLRFLPPLIITQEEVDYGLSVLELVLKGK